MEHCHPSATAPRAGIDPAAPLQSAPAAGPPCPRKPRQCTADYRWTQPKVLAFLEALSRCGKVVEAARMVGMSGTSAYRLRARMASIRFDAAFEGARRSGIRARAEASRARLAAAKAAAGRSRWEGPGIAQLAARERAHEAAGAQGECSDGQGAAGPSQGAASGTQGAAPAAQGAVASRKVTVECAR